jgi:hypothetical protein
VFRNAAQGDWFRTQEIMAPNIGPRGASSFPGLLRFLAIGPFAGLWHFRGSYRCQCHHRALAESARRENQGWSCGTIWDLESGWLIPNFNFCRFLKNPPVIDPVPPSLLRLNSVQPSGGQPPKIDCNPATLSVMISKGKPCGAVTRAGSCLSLGSREAATRQSRHPARGLCLISQPFR